VVTSAPRHPLTTALQQADDGRHPKQALFGAAPGLIWPLPADRTRSLEWLRSLEPRAIGCPRGRSGPAAIWRTACRRSRAAEAVSLLEGRTGGGRLGPGERRLLVELYKPVGASTSKHCHCEQWYAKKPGVDASLVSLLSA